MFNLRGVEADEPAMVSEQSQASHSKVTKVSRDDRACAFPTIQIRVARNSKPLAVEDLGRSTTQRRSWPGVSASRAGKIGSAGVGVVLGVAGSLCFFTNSLARASNHLRRTPLDQAPGGCPALIGPK